jgi:uncharacterized 2Fe-2S/4Fe-4S cluster protein (DUF4445 family)
MNGDKVRVQLEPMSVVAEVPRGGTLASVLPELGVEFPCGGTALCGACRVRVLEGSLSITEPDRSVFSAIELADGWRLACQAHAETPLVLECGQWRMDILADDSSLPGAGKRGLGIAIDLGTTTMVAQMVDLATGNVLGVETALNPQASFGSDVMSRISAVLQGADLTTVVRLALRQMVTKLTRGREAEIAEVVLVGNTVMHHLFCGLDVEPLSHAPFHSSHLSAQFFRPQELGWPLPDFCRIHFARCLGGFVGSDILAGILAAGISRSEDLNALVDLGTNGEIAIGNRNGIVCASTAAGPGVHGRHLARFALTQRDVRHRDWRWECPGHLRQRSRRCCRRWPGKRCDSVVRAHCQSFEAVSGEGSGRSISGRYSRVATGKSRHRFWFQNIAETPQREFRQS